MAMIIPGISADFEAILGRVGPDWLASVRQSMIDGDAAAALKTSQQARDKNRRKGDKTGEGVSLIAAAHAAFEVGKYDLGAKASSEALHLFQSVKHPAGESAALLLISQACVISADFAEAVSSAEDATIVAKASGATTQIAYCKAAVASTILMLLRTKENVDPDFSAKALEAAQEATSAFRQMGDQRALAKVVLDLAMAYLISGNSNMALAKAKMGQQMLQASGDIAGEAQASIIIAKALQKEDSVKNAMQTLEDAASLFASIGDQQGQDLSSRLMEDIQSTSAQERRDLTQRVIARTRENGMQSQSASGKAHFFMPPQQPVTLGLATTRFIGFMGRAATVVAPKGASGSGPQQNRALLYNVSWS